MNVFCLIGTVLFTLFAYWQLNDLGQYGTQWWQGWLLTYLGTALLCGVTAFRTLPRWVYLSSAGMAFVHAIFRAFAIHPDKTILYNSTNPAGNEAGGLLIVCLWLGIMAYKKR